MSQTDDARQGNDTGRQDIIAVALDYEPTKDRAPKVVAGGRGTNAEQILEIAFANDVKVREDADLAQLLGAVGIGSEIPAAAFAAVAEILIYVYRANGGVPPSLCEAEPSGGSTG